MSIRAKKVKKVMEKFFEDVFHPGPGPGAGWIDYSPYGKSLSGKEVWEQLNKDHSNGHTSVSFAVNDQEGNPIHDSLDWKLEEFETYLEVGGWITTAANQGMREAEVLAILHDEALIYYEMPEGRQFLRVIQIDDIDKRWNHDNHRYSAIAKARIPKKWKALIEADRLTEIKDSIDEDIPGRRKGRR